MQRLKQASLQPNAKGEQGARCASAAFAHDEKTSSSKRRAPEQDCITRERPPAPSWRRAVFREFRRGEGVLLRSPRPRIASRAAEKLQALGEENDHDPSLRRHRQVDRQHRDWHLRLSKLRAPARNTCRGQKAVDTGFLRPRIPWRSSPLVPRGVVGRLSIRVSQALVSPFVRRRRDCHCGLR